MKLSFNLLLLKDAMLLLLKIMRFLGYNHALATPAFCLELLDNPFSKVCVYN